MEKKLRGYKGMLRNRLPTLVNYALKWQKAKEHWIDHAYNNFINIYVDKEQRKKATRIVLCLKYTHVKQKGQTRVNEEQNFDFYKAIDWDNLLIKEYDSKKEKKSDPLYWQRKSTWDTIFTLTTWFENNYASIKDAYESSRKAGKDEFDIKVHLIQNHLSVFLPSDDDTEEKKQEMYDFIDNLVDFLIDCFNGRIR